MIDSHFQPMTMTSTTTMTAAGAISDRRQARPSVRRSRLPTSPTAAGAVLAALALVLLSLPLTSARQLPLANSLAPPTPLQLIRSCLQRPAAKFQFTSLPHKFEPSDAVFDTASQSLWVVSDDGTLAQFSPLDGRLLRSWFIELPVAPSTLVAFGDPKLAKRHDDDHDADDESSEPRRADLEGLTLIPTRPDFLYLGVESPPTILEFHPQLNKITRAFPMTHAMGGPVVLNDLGGIEALTYVPDAEDPDLGFFFVGRQEDARIFVFQVPAALADPVGVSQTQVSEMRYLGAIRPPGPGKDLSALYSTAGSQLFAVFDKAQELIEVDLLDKRIAAVMGLSRVGAASVDNVVALVDMSRVKSAVVETPRRGIEAFAIAPTADGQLHLFVGLDHNKKKVRELHRYTCKVDDT